MTVDQCYLRLGEWDRQQVEKVQSTGKPSGWRGGSQGSFPDSMSREGALVV